MTRANKRKWSSVWVALSLSAGATACGSGSLADPSPGTDSNANSPPGSMVDGSGAPVAGDPAKGPSSGDPDNAPSSGGSGAAESGTRAARLTYAEYERAVSDLVHLEISPAAQFPDEQATLDGYYATDTLRVNERLYNEMLRSAADVAANLVATPSAYAQVVGCSETEPACRDTFLQDFGLRAFRRPLTDSELERYRNLFDKAPELIASGNAFADGVQVIVEAMLQSPNFLYRIERGKADADSLGTPLTDYEVATRLAFMLLGTTPDDELLAAAGAQELSTPEQIAAQAERLVALPEVKERVVDFHQRWLEFDALDGVSKDVTVFPSYTPELANSMRAETLRFVEEVTLNNDGGIAELLTANYTFVDSNLAPLYGVEGDFGSELQRVELTDGVRSGLLTQGSFLLGHTSSSTTTSPILRGVFVLRRLLCQVIPTPPANAAQQEPPPSETPLVTTRDFFTWKTSMPACSGCHGLINPVGFAFEGFDAIGAARTTDHGGAVDVQGTMKLGGKALAFDGAKDLAAQLASSPELGACYAKNWFQYAYGREPAAEDSQLLSALAEKLASEDYGVRKLLVDLTGSAAFSHLPAIE